MHGGYNSTTYPLFKKLKESNIVSEIFIITKQKENPLYSNLCTYIGSPEKIKIKELKTFINNHNINLAITFREDYSKSGLVDFYRNTLNIPIIGVTKNWFELEYSKKFCKEFLVNNNLLTPDYMIINNLDDLNSAIQNFGLPIVIKNNFLQAGFGSHICFDKKDSIKITKNLINTFSFCIAEKFIKGEEISQMYLWDEHSLIPFDTVRDFKKLKVKDKDINTGGLACFSPVHLSNEKSKMLDSYNQQLSDIFNTLKPDFTGIFTANLLFTDDNVYTLEFNMRPGISEFETLIERMDFDLAELLYMASLNKADKNIIKYKKGTTACISVIHKNYFKQQKRIRKININQILTVNLNKLSINPNFIQIKNQPDNIKYNEARPIYTVLNTSINNPFLDIYDYLKNIRNKNFYFKQNIGEKL